MTPNRQVEIVKQEFREHFGYAPEFVVRSPGRVNLIGEHTDYNDGYVFPAAIDFEVVIACAPRPDNTARVRSSVFDETVEFSLGQILSDAQAKWSNYVRAVTQQLIKRNYPVRGYDAVITGNVPLSSGLSSSAALEVASCLAIETTNHLTISPVDRAIICQTAEIEFVGVNCGIMDQFVSSNGVKGHALFLDTRSLAFKPVPLPSNDISIVIGDTNKPRGLVDSEYNNRRAECEEAVTAISQINPAIHSLRDATMEDLNAARSHMSDTVYRRGRHIITENNRVLASIGLLEGGDIHGFGKLMNESHDSLRSDYEVSCFELDTMVNSAREIDGVYGSRMTGAGFGGCTVSLVDSHYVSEFEERVSREYSQRTGLPATIYVCSAEDGASRIE